MTRWRQLTLVLSVLLACAAAARAVDGTPEILTPPPPASPRINGPGVFGVRPGSPFLFTIAATGERPIQFAVDGLPDGLTLDPANGRITGALKDAGEHAVILRARNARGSAEKRFRIVVGERIALTPPLGWNSWNSWAESVDQDKVRRSAQALVDSGLSDHGWTYINIDDTWQGERGGAHGALQGNEKFADMKGLCDSIHAMGLKVGIYSTPWVTSYARFPGGSSDLASGAWSKDLADPKHWRHGKYSFAEQDARQWADWGFDYLKYDWFPNDIPHAKAMSEALRRSGRDIVYSLSNSAPIEHADDWARLANCWRTTGDIRDTWASGESDWQHGVSEIGFAQDRWAPFSGPGHWNDPDMLVVGHVGWGPKLHPSLLTPDEQYAHISLWCLLSAPLLIGCDLERLDPFTLGLLANDEVLALDQDALGKPAVRVATVDEIDIYLKELEDGSRAVGFFNRGRQDAALTFGKLSRIVRPGAHRADRVRDLWRQKDLAEVVWRRKDLDDAVGTLPVSVHPHGVVLLKLTPTD